MPKAMECMQRCNGITTQEVIWSTHKILCSNSTNGRRKIFSYGWDYWASEAFFLLLKSVGVIAGFEDVVVMSNTVSSSVVNCIAKAEISGNDQ